MIDLDLLRTNPDIFKQACKRKKISFNVDEFLKLDEQYRLAKTEFEDLRARQNQTSREIAKLQGETKEQALNAMKELANEVKAKEKAYKEIEENHRQNHLLIPSPPAEHVPDGNSDVDNKEIRTWGEKPKFDFKLRDHIELGKLLDIIDVDRGVKIAGSRNYFLKGMGARLQHAVLTYAIDFLTEREYTIMDCPHIVNYQAMMGTSYFPGGEEQAYHLDDRDPDFYLIGTSEVSVCSYHKDEILNEGNLPLRYAGYSPCYRREAGTYGKDTHGLYRIHQFYKVEQVVVCKADKQESEKMHLELLKNAEDFMQTLNLPYRVVQNCAADLGQGQIMKNDIEAWMPSRNNFGETHSCSTFYDFQARRLMMRYKNSQGKNEYCYTLNNTLIASPRILIPILENNQTKDGEILIPKVLRPYLNGQEKISIPNE